MRGWHPPGRPGTRPEGSFFLYVCATLPASPARPASHLQRVVAPRGECRARSGRPARPVLYIHTLRLSPLGACQPAGASGGWAGGLVGGGAPRRVVVEVVDDGGVEWYVWCGRWGRGQRRDWRRRRRLAQAAAGLPLGGAAPGELSAAVRPLARRHTPSDVDGVGVWVQEGSEGGLSLFARSRCSHSSPPPPEPFGRSLPGREVGSGRDGRVHPPPRRCRQRHAPPLPSTSASRNLGGASHTVRGPLTGRCNPLTPPSRAAAAARGGAAPGTVDRRGRGRRSPQCLGAGGRVFKKRHRASPPRPVLHHPPRPPPVQHRR
ncbi:hypothetical protein I4F81_003773 [Pyropia yezoensis]|uniref:Uncharacterized protein n=1 Tax=Pyropia yezoensis TaxID=2788 RepID=A0ACC3BTZ9_PYRYE|nr:hypothetical protein I4F81_003773 [Neopyropia yezoensis]